MITVLESTRPHMKLLFIAVLVIVLSAGLAGCQKSAAPNPPASAASSAVSPSPAPSQSGSPEAQIRTAILAHLAHTSNLNLQAFDTDVKQVTVQGDHAEAQVDFHVKGGPGVMQLTYQLENRGGTWAVIDSNPLGSNFSHPPLNQSQAPGTPVAPGGNSDSLADTLRSFKEGAGGVPAALPPGYPPLNNSGSPSQ
jgi:hypothetical protein